jgi:hypothetical protein
MPGLSRADQRLDLARRVKPASEDQKLSSILSNRSPTASNEFAAGTPTLDLLQSQTGVIVRSGVPSPLAHPLDRLTIQLNTNWRVIDDPLQWILQRRKGNPRKKNSGWQDRSFCTTREGLLRCVRELCGVVSKEALDELKALPEFHSEWEPSR